MGFIFPIYQDWIIQIWQSHNSKKQVLFGHEDYCNSIKTRVPHGIENRKFFYKKLSFCSFYSFSELREPISIIFAALKSSISLLFRIVFFGGSRCYWLSEIHVRLLSVSKFLDFRPDFPIFMVQITMNMEAYPSKTAGNRF